MQLGTPVPTCPNCQNECEADGLFCPNCSQFLGSERATNRPEELVGRALSSNRYRIDQLLGQGGMGTVYSALDTRLGRQVALKILAPELVAHPTARIRMTQESQALARIEHPNVVRVFDVFDEGALFVIVLELVTGGSLEQLVRKNGIGERRCLELADGILAGLEAVHRAGLVHRDVKPGNILLTAQGIPKVADLGIARDTTAQSKTRLGQKLGTLEYMSPEQVQGLHVTACADIYSTAMVLFELLTGRLPFAARTEFEWALAHVRTQPDLAPLECVASATVCDAIAKALAKEPEKRFSSARAMALALAAKPLSMPNEISEILATQQMAIPPQFTKKPAVLTPQFAPAPGRSLAKLTAVVASGAFVLALAATLGFAGSELAVQDPGAGESRVATDSAPQIGSRDEEPPPQRRVPSSTGQRGAAGREQAAEPAAAAGPDPTTGVSGYYDALNRRDLATAYQHWAMTRSANESAWRKNFGEQAQCARVLRAVETSRSGSAATIQVDLCVDDQRAGEVHRWAGSIDVILRDGVWKMASWRIGKRGFCDADCRPAI